MSTPDAEDVPWYQQAVIYQIAVALFRDTTGNGTGDLRGVTEKLDHVKELGASAVWLQPFYRTPDLDGGYDVIDHIEVSDRYGTLDDFDDLMARAKDLELEVILDLVVQHTSVGHPWFRAACRDRESRFRDFYIWTDEPHETIVKPMFPSVEDSVWTWNEEAGQYYRHTFYSHEPDLNIANADVRDEIRKIMEFWLERGASGFRVDAAPYIVAEAGRVDGHDDGYWFLEEMRRTVRRFRPDGVLMVEADVEPQRYADYFAGGDRVTTLLNFWLNNYLFLALARKDAAPLRDALEEEPVPPAGCSYAIWLRNHDELNLERLTPAEREETMSIFAPHPAMRAFGRGIRRRLAPMLDDPRQRKLAAFLLCALPGSPIILYGDEIGMGDQPELPDRAAVRPPMQWSRDVNAGFSEAHEIQLVHPVITEGPFGYAQVNVDDETGDPDSLLRTLRTLFEIRRDHGPILASSARPVALPQGQVFAISYSDERSTSLLLANLHPQGTTLTLPPDLRRDWKQIIDDQPYEDPVNGEELTLHGYGYRWLRVEQA
ncbi:alpha-amylase family protein [Nocardioides sp.]|uniref:alpha-amylase family protein n=1 Tax=Nocardioides sp. TaxID=35761 RepID=UPI0019C94C38|nr:alpha-amylase family protein [Nocardioides sp.]MBC7275558.1 alpha-amylase family protein [Nocardioides sp.]